MGFSVNEGEMAAYILQIPTKRDPFLTYLLQIVVNGEQISTQTGSMVIEKV